MKIFLHPGFSHAYSKFFFASCCAFPFRSFFLLKTLYNKFLFKSKCLVAIDSYLYWTLNVLCLIYGCRNHLSSNLFFLYIFGELLDSIFQLLVYSPPQLEVLEAVLISTHFVPFQQESLLRRKKEASVCGFHTF